MSGNTTTNDRNKRMDGVVKDMLQLDLIATLQRIEEINE
jgi:hypothetical protein